MHMYVSASYKKTWWKATFVEKHDLKAHLEVAQNKSNFLCICVFFVFNVKQIQSFVMETNTFI